MANLLFLEVVIIVLAVKIVRREVGIPGSGTSGFHCFASFKIFVDVRLHQMQLYLFGIELVNIEHPRPE